MDTRSPAIRDMDMEIRIVDTQLEALERRESEIQRVLAEMMRMQDAVAAEKEALLAQRQELDDQKYRPIQRIPAEILVEIFIFSCCSLDENSEITIAEDTHTLLNLTHTCSKWRTLCLGTSRLWTFVRLSCTGWNRDRVETFLERSRDAPLDIIYGGASPTNRCTFTSRSLTLFMDILTDNLPRLRSLSVDCKAIDTAADAVDLLLNWNEGPCNRPPQLSSLSLAITEEVAIPTVFPGATRTLSEFSNVTAEPHNVLKHLRLQRIPFMSLPPHFYTSLTTLDISFARMALTYPVPIHNLITVLSVCRELVHFTLSIETLSVQDFKSIHPIQLPRLKQIDLICDNAAVIPKLLSNLLGPVLEKVEIWLNPKSVVLWPLSSPSAENVNAKYSQLSVLRELCLQFFAQDVETLGSSVRHLTFPALSKLEIINTDPKLRSDNGIDANGESNHLFFPSLPRFESFFRDPRFPLLTHLSLSHFKIEDEKVEALLGYIPALTSLSLDNVKNCMVLLTSLSSKGPRVAPGQSPGWMTDMADVSEPKKVKRSRRRMKFCPRLEALSFWSCDLDIAVLYAMVKARNDPGQDDVDESGPFTTIHARDTAKHATAFPARRVIKPLRRTKLAPRAAEGDSQAPEQVGPFLLESGATVLASPAMLQAMQSSKAQPPSRISYIRLAGCGGVDQVWVTKLGTWVNDVVWSEQ